MFIVLSRRICFSIFDLDIDLESSRRDLGHVKFKAFWDISLETVHATLDSQVALFMDLVATEGRLSYEAYNVDTEPTNYKEHRTIQIQT